MNRLVFVRDGRYINQQYEDELRKLLDTDYPGMRFTSYKASNMSVDQLLDSLNVTDTGIPACSFPRGTTQEISPVIPR